MIRSLAYLLIPTAFISLNAFAETNQCLLDMNSHIQEFTIDESVGIEKSLWLADCGIKDSDVPAIVDYMNAHQDVKNLFLWDNNIHAQGAEKLTELKAGKWIALDNNHLGDEGAIALAQKSTAIWFTLSGNDISDTGATALAGNASLKMLGLAGNQISDKGASAFSTSYNLDFLALDSNLVGNEGAIALARNANLKALSLESNKITAEGAVALAGHAGLQYLNLNRNNIGDEGALAFVNRQTALELDIAFNNVSESVISQLLNNAMLNVYYSEGTETEYAINANGAKKAKLANVGRLAQIKKLVSNVKK